VTHEHASPATRPLFPRNSLLPLFFFIFSFLRPFASLVRFVKRSSTSLLLPPPSFPRHRKHPTRTKRSGPPISFLNSKRDVAPAPLFSFSSLLLLEVAQDVKRLSFLLLVSVNKGGVELFFLPLLAYASSDSVILFPSFLLSRRSRRSTSPLPFPLLPSSSPLGK